MRTVVVDRRDLRARLIETLVARSTLQIVGEADDGASAVELTHRLEPEVVIVGDLGGPMRLADAIRVIKASSPSVLVLCVGESARSQAAGLIEAGASGFLHRDHPESLLYQLFPV